MGRVGDGKHGRARGDALLGQAVVHVGGRQQAEADVMVFGVVPGEEDVSAWARASWIEPNRPGNSGRYFSVLNWASENGLSFDTCGRPCVLVTPRSASNRATGFEVIADPRSAWTVSCSRPMPWRAHVSRMNCSARSALSRWATIQPTT